MNSGTLSIRHERWCVTPLFNNLIQHGHGARCGDTPRGVGGEGLSRELVSHVQDLDGPAIGCFVELKVKGQTWLG